MPKQCQPEGDGFYTKRTGEVTSQFHKDAGTNKTGFIGVTKVTRHGKIKFQASIRVHGRKNKLWCGQSDKAEEAAKLYDIKARELYGESAVTNFE